MVAVTSPPADKDTGQGLSRDSAGVIGMPEEAADAAPKKRRTLMWRGDPLRDGLMALLLLSAILVPVGIYLAVDAGRSIETERRLHASAKSIAAQLDAFSSLQRAIGYTHFIHNFKNGVLRRLPERLDMAMADLESAGLALRTLRGLNPELSGAADDMAATLAEYHRKAALAKILIASDMTPTEIDIQVKVNDTAAGHALEVIYDEINRARGKLAADIDDQQTYMGRQRDIMIASAVGMVLVGGALVWIYFLVSGRARVLLATRERLADLSGAFAGDGETDDHVSGVEAAIHNLSDEIEGQQRDLMRHAEDLQKANEELQRFSYVASHDLQEPLRKIQSNIDLIGVHHGENLSEDMSKRLARIDRAAGEMRRLIDDLLAYSRNASRAVKLKPLDVSSLIDGVVADLSEELEENGGRVLNEVAQGVVIVGDRTMLGQVIANIVRNALKYARTGAPPRVTVSSVLQDDWLTLELADNGIGFENEYAEEIFKPFTRLHPKARFEGSGIGLSIVKNVVLRHGGDVVALGTPGEGAVFTLRLPVSGPNTGAAKTEEGGADER